MSDLIEQLSAALENRYTIERELGRGGMATVFLALDLKHDRKVAIKVMGHDAAQQMGAERFDREIKTAAKLSHPAILQLFDSGEANGILYYVMPYVQDGSLAERLEREGQLPIDDALDIAREVAEALHHAHQKNIIHRDIKPENILFLSGRPVLADFGIARAMDPTGQQLTQTGMAVGTPAYMSPEQGAGDSNLDGRSDVYSLGCVLYEMISGHPPFMGAPREIIARHMTDAVPSLKTARPTVPDNVDETIVRSMAKMPADRFATAHDFAEALAGRKAALAATASGPARQQLFSGRSLGILVGYLAVTLIAWLGTATLADRFALSPHLPTFVLAALGFLLPAAGVVAYTLGNGGIRWRAAQTLGVSANAVAAGLALFLLFNGKDLGAATISVTLTDEEGNTIERVIPKAEFRTRIAIFDFDADAADSSLQWLQYGIPAALSVDLVQDLYIDQRVSTNFREDLRERGFQDLTGVPLALKREIAAEQFRDRFVTGRVAVDGDEIVVTMTVYDTRSGRELRRTTVRGTDPLALVDELARDVKGTVDVPEGYASEIRDLPASELLTSSPAAFQAFARALRAITVRDDWAGALELLQQAVAEDPTFALGQFVLAQAYIYGNRGDEAAGPLQAAVDHVYRLPERAQNQIKAQWYEMRNEQDKSYALHEMNAELFPQDVNVQATLAQLQIIRDQRREAIATYERILEFDPGQHDFLRAIGGIYQSLGEYEQALDAFNRYAELNPEDERSFVDLGDLHRTQGNHTEARAAYDRALLVEPADIGTAVRVANIDLVTGDFDAARKGYADALGSARTATDSVTALSGMASYHRYRGEMKEALRLRQQQNAVAATVNPPVQNIINQLQTVDDFVAAGDTAQAEQLLGTLSQQLQAPFDRFPSIGQLEFALALEDADLIDSAIVQVELLIQQFSLEVFRPRIAYAQGRAHMLRGEYREAIASWEQEQELNPGDWSVNRQLGGAYRELGELDREIARHHRAHGMN